ncbi:TlpA disulfide reductase family protein [Bacteriovorax sp. PP10]|uniref:TlpA disulfide reductase family protein n=1 Tax=Bacteriovorax antarcticus TaxID=3088717 RepID=A0ABU5VWI6_9BACT|nr:TlpA disulfide reductase family protein [Bacteriovorax sp. PP10]MEA9357423.1 TlpA disulfide reductase family protein [Bacteriovorax sp. PP10]
MNKKNFINTLFFIVAVYALYLKLPSILTHFKYQDQKAPDFTVKMTNGENFNLVTQPKKIVVVFWATWCGPCEIELKRINKMVMERKILPSDVLAISSNEEESIVREKAKRENYLFNIGLDTNGSIANQYQVSATPTIMFIDEKQIVNWMTSGLSPTLEFRITSFLK